MQHAVALSGEEDEHVIQSSTSLDTESSPPHPTTSAPIQLIFSYAWIGIKLLFHLLRPSTISYGYDQLSQMTFKDLIKYSFLLLIKCIRLLFIILIYTLR